MSLLIARADLGERVTRDWWMGINRGGQDEREALVREAELG
jgi:hypothetical protein